MHDAYVTLSDERIDLAGLSAEAKRFLGQAMRAYQSGEAYPNFVNRVHAPGSPALGGGRWVTAEVSRSALYRICQDLADRLGIAQGFLATEPATSDEGTDAGSVPQEALSCEDAAKRLGVSGEAVRKAIREGRLPARQVGRTYVLDALSVDAYAARSGRRVALAAASKARARVRSATPRRAMTKRRRAPA